MSFQSLAFFGFLAAALAVCLTAGRRSPRAGAAMLAAASAVFYLLGPGGWTVVLGGIACLLAGICVTACAIRRMARSGGRRRTMVLACVYHIAILVGFKYTEFLTGGAVEVGWAPLGLSFFTFQQLWLLKEVYTGEYVPAPGDSLLLYGLFFPTVTSGPILRPGIFFPQLREKGFLHPDWSDAAAGIYAICCGTIKKVLLADAFGTVVNNGWVHLEELSAPAAWLVILGYTLQLYFDFSGYCDIAAGVARLFGLRLPMNFDSPYRSASVTEFWKRWHITLTTFLRECLYFPLGGSRRGAIRTYCNILIVFLVSGFWHGAGWTFLVWGALHGLAQVVERVWGRGRDRLPFVLRWGLTFLFVNIAWVFFRAPDCTGALELLGRAVTGRLCKTGGLAAGGPFRRGDQRGADADSRLHALEKHPAGGAAVWGGDGRRPLAPEHHPSDGGLPAYALAGRGPHSADALVCAVLYRRHHLHLFQLLRRAV